MDHDGHVGAAHGISTFMKAPDFDGYTAQQKADINAYVVSFDTDRPLLSALRVPSPRAMSRARPRKETGLCYRAEAAIPNVDLIVRGTLNGQVHGLLYQPTAGTYISDTGTLYTQAQLQTLVLAGDTLNIMGVYPGTGSATVGTILAAAQPAANTAPTVNKVARAQIKQPDVMFAGPRVTLRFYRTLVPANYLNTEADPRILCVCAAVAS